MADIQAWLVLVTTLVTALSGLVPVVILIWKRLSAQERRLERFWRARMLRGTAEGLNRKMIVEQIGPDESVDPDGGFMTVAVTPEIAKLYAPITDHLLAMREKHKDESDEYLAERIEDRFGPWLARHICVPLGVSEYACIVAALSIAKGIKPCEIPPDHN